MRRSVTVALGAILLLGVSALVWKGSGPPTTRPARDASAAASASIDVTTLADGGLHDDPLFMGLLNGPDAGVAESPDLAGSALAALPADAPKLVRFGVILVQYRGAQGAPPSARSRDEASALARTLSAAAKTDFNAQVVKGDPGSLDDAGRIPRGVLEPSTELVLFTLAKGAVSEPLDTPRGFWIIKRID